MKKQNIKLNLADIYSQNKNYSTEELSEINKKFSLSVSDLFHDTAVDFDLKGNGYYEKELIIKVDKKTTFKFEKNPTIINDSTMPFLYMKEVQKILEGCTDDSVVIFKIAVFAQHTINNCNIIEQQKLHMQSLSKINKIQQFNASFNNHMSGYMVRPGFELTKTFKASYIKEHLKKALETVDDEKDSTSFNDFLNRALIDMGSYLKNTGVTGLNVYINKVFENNFDNVDIDFDVLISNLEKGIKHYYDILNNNDEIRSTIGVYVSCRMGRYSYLLENIKDDNHQNIIKTLAMLFSIYNTILVMHKHYKEGKIDKTDINVINIINTALYGFMEMVDEETKSKPTTIHKALSMCGKILREYGIITTNEKKVVIFEDMNNTQISAMV